MPTQKGIGVVWGVSTGAITAGTGRLLHTGQSLSEDIEISEHRDNSGEFIGVSTFAGTKTLELEVYPASAVSSPTVAQSANAMISCPVPGDKVTLTDSTDGDVAGDWMVISASRRKSNTDKVTITMSLKRWNGLTSYDTVTAS
jgi:hypothetical protein